MGDLHEINNWEICDQDGIQETYDTLIYLIALILNIKLKLLDALFPFSTSFEIVKFISRKSSRKISLLKENYFFRLL